MRDPYPATFQRRHHNVISPVPPFYTRNNNLSNRIPFETKVEESSIASRIILMQKAGYKAAVFCSKDTCSDNPPTTGWYNILYWGLSNEQIILASCTWQPKTTYYGVFNLDETAPTITWREIVTKSDLLNLSRTFVSGDSLSDVKDLSIPPGIYVVNPGIKNTPENTYGVLEITADSHSNWRFLKFVPTNIKSFYLMFYNGYDKAWTDWIHFASTTL